MGDLSPHFDSSEFVDHQTGESHPIDPKLVACLERLRSAIGRPVPIVSGFRSPSTNRAVGGAPQSQHLYGRAADVPRGLATVAQAREAGFVGIGSRGAWAVHLDVRQPPLVVFREGVTSGAVA